MPGEIQESEIRVRSRDSPEPAILYTAGSGVSASKAVGRRRAQSVSTETRAERSHASMTGM